MLKQFFSGLLALIIHGLAFGQEGQAPLQQCAIGPQERTFSHTKWLLYGCDGAMAAALVPAKGNPAAPFFFVVFRDGASYRVYGEGLGDKKVTGAVMEELKSLSAAALAQLILEAQAPKH